VILMGSQFWAGLVEWLKKTLVKEKTISESDLDLFRIVDTPDDPFHGWIEDGACYGVRGGFVEVNQ
jgi:predicted Rossmann-fold nucleotide-binding protein